MVMPCRGGQAADRFVGRLYRFTPRFAGRWGAPPRAARELPEVILRLSGATLPVLVGLYHRHATFGSNENAPPATCRWNIVRPFVAATPRRWYTAEYERCGPVWSILPERLETVP
jgi:hypothetical protein